MSSKILKPYYLLFVIAALLLAGCYRQGFTAAPVVKLSKPASSFTSNTKVYRVKKGDTLYSIAWAYGLDYQGLAAANNLPPPYRIHPRRIIQLKTAPVSQPIYATQISRARVKPNTWSKKQDVASNKQIGRWVWPARGRVVEGFASELAGNKGLDIAGKWNEAIRAAANGTVVYSGDGVRGYGNLIIIKHNNSYLSAYAFNQSNLVRVGEQVKAGQAIARMGRNNAGKVMLHFEIRRNGVPINPHTYLR